MEAVGKEVSSAAEEVVTMVEEAATTAEEVESEIYLFGGLEAIGYAIVACRKDQLGEIVFPGLLEITGYIDYQMDEIKEAFPVRIEVSREAGSGSTFSIT